MSRSAPVNLPSAPTRGALAVGFSVRNKLFVFGAGLFGLILLTALFAPWLAPYDPNAINFAVKLDPPSWTHWMGTDDLGRDILSRVIYGARTSLIIGFNVILIAMAIGVPIGLLSGYFGGRLDMVLMRVTDVFLAFPPLLLPIAITAALGPSLVNAMLALAISWFPWYARIMRGAVMSIRSQLFVSAARTMRISQLKILVRHILPNAWTPALVQASMDFGYTILAAASLSFIGIGAKPPTIEWGLMVALSRSKFLDFWWTAAFPGLAIFITVLAVNLIGDGLRDILDPRARGV
ncbi:ABC transporter permease [Marinobacter sp. X15-166B]|uniref:ABC transporter permease n=1 Tax=Marinobacter sp. X15-166B TaxID=1897620 RepID=UPI00085BF107|nr:ABC transporter permease [Marinobacter sp. X15-166B]OEY67483.1 D-ala-D-ala transporter subunit [Marinobacter sp. X15-166B]